jgi:ATP-binding cassette subfamily B protein/ATP-binding cassette subfamily C protein
MATDKRKLSFREQAKAIGGVASLSFRAAPGAVLFKLGGAIFDAVLPFITTYFAALTTTALAAAYAGDEKASHQVITYVLITAGLGLFMTIWRSIDQYIQAQMRFVVEARVSDRMYEHFLALDFWHYDDKDTADLYDKAQKFSQFFAYVFDRIAGVLSQFITMVAGVGALLFVNGWLALFILLALIPGVYLQFKLSRAQVEHWNNNIDVRRSKGMIEWSLLQPKMLVELRLYGMVNHLLQLRSKLRDADEKTRIDFERKFMAKRLLADGLEAVAEVSSLIWITTQVIARAQPVGQFLYVQQVVSRAIGGSNSFVSQLSGIDEDIANLFDYEQFMELPERKGGDVDIAEVPEKIEFKNVSFHYPSDTPQNVLQDISLTINRNQHVAIVGENGAGKSTLIKILTGVYAPTAGDVLIDGTPLHKVNISSWHKLLAVLQQEFVKYRFATVKENVEFGNIEKVGDAEKALQTAEALEFVQKLPRSLDNYVDNWMEDADGNKGTDLSGGQWQRLALARNFYRDAPIIILDEPTSAIDALAESRIFERLLKEKNKTIITVSHRLTTVEKADIIYMLENGRIIESGTHKELVAKRGKYVTMFRSQLHESERE